MSAFLFIMVLNTLKFTIQEEKKRIFIFKYCKIDVKSAATLFFAATLITAPVCLKFNNIRFTNLTLSVCLSGSL